jgi:hypothetical protein
MKWFHALDIGRNIAEEKQRWGSCSLTRKDRHGRLDEAEIGKCIIDQYKGFAYSSDWRFSYRVDELSQTIAKLRLFQGAKFGGIDRRDYCQCHHAGQGIKESTGGFSE